MGVIPILVKRAITLKVKVTGSYKESVLRDLEKNLNQVELELQQLEFQGKRYLQEVEKHGAEPIAAVKQRLEREKQKRLELRDKMRQKQIEVAGWQIGSEVVQGTLEGMVDLSVGDTMDRLLQAEVIVQDGVILEIRNG
ncbi:MAG: YlqD family protein [bacterium]|jgi:hypothetical protein